MKKLTVVMFIIAMMVTVASIACADVGFTVYNAPCEAIADSDLYKHVSDQEVYKFSSGDNRFFVKHRVTEITDDDIVETNRIAAYRQDTRKTMGANWHPADYGEYQCQSNLIAIGHSYSVAARGNTNYETKYGLNTITLSGRMRAD